MAARSAESTVPLILCAVADALGLERLTPELPEDRPVSTAYATDLLSDVLAHLHAIAVAVHADLAGVVFALGRRPDEAALRRAVEQGIAVYASPDTTFNIVGRLYALGLRGDSK